MLWLIQKITHWFQSDPHDLDQHCLFSWKWGSGTSQTYVPEWDRQMEWRHNCVIQLQYRKGCMINQHCRLSTDSTANRLLRSTSVIIMVLQVTCHRAKCMTLNRSQKISTNTDREKVGLFCGLSMSRSQRVPHPPSTAQLSDVMHRQRKVR